MIISYYNTMDYKLDQISSENSDEKTIVVWDKKYATGIECIDMQHKELVELCNKLHQATLGDKNTLEGVFTEAMHKMVDYVKFHFNSELILLQRINYPQFNEHKKEHEELIVKIIEAAKDYSEGKKFVAYKFVRILRDWVFGHIAFYDKQYASYVREQLRKGLLTQKQLCGCDSCHP